MKIAIGFNDAIDAGDLPVAVILTADDKENIANMAPDATIYSSFPDGADLDDVRAWLTRLKEGQ